MTTSAPARGLARLRPEIPAGRFVAHPFALVAAFVLNVYVETGVSPFAMFRSLAVAVGGVGLVVAVAWLLLRDRHRAGAVATLILVLLVGWSAPVLLAAALALLVVIVLLVRRITAAGVPWPRVTYVLNVFSFALFAAVVLKIVTGGWLGQIAADLQQGGPLPPPAAAPRSGGPPDIYLVLLDGYPRADTLERLFGYDNEPFLRELAARGFDVSPHSRSNYSNTQLTLASMLNMRLLDEMDEIGPLMTGERRMQPALRNLTSDGTALRRLRERGYEIVATAPGFEEMALRRADVFLDSGQLNEFEVTLMRLTALSSLTTVIAPDFVAGQQRGRVEAGFRDIAEIVKRPSTKPTFAFLHLPTPHAPILYGRNGEPRPVDPRHPNDYDSGNPQTRDDKVAQYVEQLSYVNEQVLAAIDAAFARPGLEPIVVLWSDHGSLINLDDDVALRQHERVSNLFAARTPGHPGLFGDAPTLVNTFPILFEAYFGEELPRSADRTFVSEPSALFEWVEIPNPDADGD